ncbi:MAG: GTPase Era, partial [Legionella sp.]|nr:GTPase Era [Legionella sp.]
LEALLKPLMQEGPHLFDEDQITDRSKRFLCAEILREKIFRFSGQELPYSITVDIESYEETEKLVKIQALILVERENHKRMIIGERGSKLKTIASQARLDMERLLDQSVFLQCWCKVKSGWSDDARILKQLGYEN